MTSLPGIAAVLAAMLSPARIQTKLDAIQATLSSRRDPPPKYAIYDHNTLIAAYRWRDDDGPNGLIVAYRVTADGGLRRLATFEYGDSPSDLALLDATGDDRPEILVTGTSADGPPPLEIIAWDGKHFACIGETTASGTAFIDVDNDGVPEVLTHGWSSVTNDCGARIVTPLVQQYDDDMLVDVASPGLEDFVDTTKATDEPQTFEQEVTLRDDASKSVTLQIVNGTRDGRHRATSLTLDAGDKTVPVNLTSSDATLEVPVTLDSRCPRFRLTVSGPRGARLSILVRSPRP